LFEDVEWDFVIEFLIFSFTHFISFFLPSVAHVFLSALSTSEPVSRRPT
jgi:hypothetical protein